MRQQEAVILFEAALQEAVDSALNITNAVLGRKPQTPTDDERVVLNNLNAQRKEFETKITAARDAVEKLKPELAACIKEHCGPGATPATRGEAPLSHPQPVSTCRPDCDDLARAASDALFLVLASEKSCAQERSRIHDLRTWLSVHSGEQGSPEYNRNASDLVAEERRLILSEAERARRQRELDARIIRLTSCNLSCRRPAVTTPTVFSLGPSEEVPKAICPACEGAALKLKADLAALKFAQATQERDNARWAAVSAKVSGPAATQADRNALNAIEKALLDDEREVARAQEDVTKSRAALDVCNKEHPAESCKPPGSQSGLPGGAGGKSDTPKDTAPKDTTPKDTTPKDTTPKDTTPKDTTPKDTTPKDTTPKAPVPGGTGMLHGDFEGGDFHDHVRGSRLWQLSLLSPAQRRLQHGAKRRATAGGAGAFQYEYWR